MKTETNRVSFFVAHDPVPLPRQRHRVVWPKGAVRMALLTLKKKVFVQNYMPKTHAVHDYRKAVKRAASEAFDGDPLDGPLFFRAVFLMPRTQAEVWKTRPMPRFRHTKKPDLDNLAKALKDSMTGIVWRDDSQVCVELLEKWVAAGNETPGVEVLVEKILPQEQQSSLFS